MFRHWVPESPRWLTTHGRAREAEEIVESVEREVTADPSALTPLRGKPQRLRIREYTPWSEIWHAIAHQYPTRSVLGFTLMVTQAFLYNAIFFTYALILVQFYNVPPETVSVYLFPFAFGNLLGPIVLGRLFDTVGRTQFRRCRATISGPEPISHLTHPGVSTPAAFRCNLWVRETRIKVKGSVWHRQFRESTQEGDVFRFNTAGAYDRGESWGPRVVRGMYGRSERYIDVTNQLRDYARRGEGFRVSPEAFGLDPERVQGSRLSMTVIDRSGERVEREYEEGDYVDFR